MGSKNNDTPSVLRILESVLRLLRRNPGGLALPELFVAGGWCSLEDDCAAGTIQSEPSIDQSVRIIGIKMCVIVTFV